MPSETDSPIQVEITEEKISVLYQGVPLQGFSGLSLKARDGQRPTLILEFSAPDFCFSGLLPGLEMRFLGHNPFS